MKKKYFVVLICLVFAVLSMTVSVSAVESEIKSGTCGKNLTWELDRSTGVLTISGSGAMNSFSYRNTPWHDFTSEITSIVLPKGITTIGQYAFSYCNIKNITIPDGVLSIENWAFMYCRELITVKIPDSVQSIGRNVFLDCYSLKEVNIPDGVSSLGVGIFCRCTSLENIEIPSSVTDFDLYAFQDCSSLRSIKIPRGETKIDSAFFLRCSSLESVSLPSTVAYIADNAFDGCDELQTLHYCGTEERWSKIVSENVKPDFDGVSVSFGHEFIGNKCVHCSVPEPKITSGACGENLTWEWDRETGVLTISGSGAMTSFSYRDTPWYDFSTEITEIVLPEGLTTIGQYAFSYCNIKNIAIPDGVTSIENWAFIFCCDLVRVEIPDSVRSIGRTVFLDCYSLKKVNIPNGITYLGQSVFCRCTSLEHIDIPSSVTGFGLYAFQDCSSLKEIKIPHGETKIGAAFFLRCYSLESVALPASVDFIEVNAFANCDSLKNLHYCGTEQKWNNFMSEEVKQDLAGVTITFGHEAADGKCIYCSIAGPADKPNMVVFDDLNLSDSEIAYGAVYDDTGRMILLEKAVLLDGKGVIYLNDPIYNHMDVSRLFVVNKESFAPMQISVTVNK